MPVRQILLMYISLSYLLMSHLVKEHRVSSYLHLDCGCDYGSESGLGSCALPGSMDLFFHMDDGKLEADLIADGRNPGLVESRSVPTKQRLGVWPFRQIAAVEEPTQTTMVSSRQQYNVHHRIDYQSSLFPLEKSQRCGGGWFRRLHGLRQLSFSQQPFAPARRKILNREFPLVLVLAMSSEMRSRQ